MSFFVYLKIDFFASISQWSLLYAFCDMSVKKKIAGLRRGGLYRAPWSVRLQQDCE